MEKTVDFAAVGRVARHTELKDVRIVEMLAKCSPKLTGDLHPSIDLHCSIVGKDEKMLEVACDCSFSAHCGETLAAQVQIQYLLTYKLSTSEHLDDDDLSQFASANGALHSWPFLRETLYSIISRMGYPPFTLPVMHFHPKPPAESKPEEEEVLLGDEAAE
jgi:preprotein translocase subunit SecB